MGVRGKFQLVLQIKETFACTYKQNMHQQYSILKKQKLRGLISASDYKIQMLTYSQ